MAASDEGLGLEGEAEAPHETQKNPPKNVLGFGERNMAASRLEMLFIRAFPRNKQASKQASKFENGVVCARAPRGADRRSGAPIARGATGHRAPPLSSH